MHLSGMMSVEGGAKPGRHSSAFAAAARIKKGTGGPRGPRRKREIDKLGVGVGYVGVNTLRVLQRR
jgi:hypothetical protein